MLVQNLRNITVLVPVLYSWCTYWHVLSVEHMAQLEQVAYTLAHSSFSLSSPAEISEILYTVRRLIVIVWPFKFKA